jgi:hypothetical protein
MLQVVLALRIVILTTLESPMITILTTLEVLFMLLMNIEGITYNCQKNIVQATSVGHRDKTIVQMLAKMFLHLKLLCLLLMGPLLVLTQSKETVS